MYWASTLRFLGYTTSHGEQIQITIMFGGRRLHEYDIEDSVVYEIA